MIHIVVLSTKDEYSWRFIMDPIDRHLEIRVPDISMSDTEFALAQLALLSAMRCRQSGHLTLELHNVQGISDKCKGDPRTHVYDLDTENAAYSIAVDPGVVKCWLKLLESK